MRIMAILMELIAHIVMARLNELWPLIERTDVREVKYPISVNCSIKIETAHTNDFAIMEMIEFVQKWLRGGKLWEFKSIDVKSHEELVELQRKNGGAVRRCANVEDDVEDVEDVDDVDDEDIDRGYEGWIAIPRRYHFWRVEK